MTYTRRDRVMARAGTLQSRKPPPPNNKSPRPCEGLTFKVGAGVVSRPADNASTNGEVARKISDFTEQNFDHDTNRLGFVAHWLNLAAKDGLKFIGKVNDESDFFFWCF